MKRLLLFVLLCVSITASYAQYDRADIWKGDMERFAAEDSARGPLRGGVLFVGSSTITGWPDLAQSFPEVEVRNRGFGGSIATDHIYYFDRSIAPHLPDQVVIYIGSNDLCDPVKTPELFMEDLTCLVHMIHVSLPHARILLLGINPCTSRIAQTERYRQANEAMSRLAEQYDYLTYAAAWDQIMDAEGKVRDELFQPDLLHLNRDGYAVMVDMLRPLLLSEDQAD